MTADKGQTPIRLAAGEEEDLMTRLRNSGVALSRSWAAVKALCNEAADTIATLTAQLAAAEARVAVAAEALMEARSDILSMAHARWSEVEASDKELVDYIDTALINLTQETDNAD